MDPALRIYLPLAHDWLLQVLEAFANMIFVDGVFQADPHPGNLLLEDPVKGGERAEAEGGWTADAPQPPSEEQTEASGSGRNEVPPSP